MERTKLLQEVRKMRFEEACEGWREGRLSQCEAARWRWRMARACWLDTLLMGNR